MFDIHHYTNEVIRLRESVESLVKQQHDFQTTIKKYMSDLDQKIQDLTDEVAKQTTVEKSALALIQGFGAQLAAAVAAASAAGATPAQLKALTDLKTTLAANDTELSDAVTANTPAATP